MPVVSTATTATAGIHVITTNRPYFDLREPTLIGHCHVLPQHGTRPRERRDVRLRELPGSPRRDPGPRIRRQPLLGTSVGLWILQCRRFRGDGRVDTSPRVRADAPLGVPRSVGGSEERRIDERSCAVRQRSRARRFRRVANSHPDGSVSDRSRALAARVGNIPVNVGCSAGGPFGGRTDRTAAQDSVESRREWSPPPGDLRRRLAVRQ